MAVVRFPDEGRTVTGEAAVRETLGRVGIDYERWQPSHPVPAGAPAEAVLAAYAAEINRLKAAGGYVTADVIDVSPETPNLDAMLAKFRKEHWHDEDEVRFIVKGHGLFHIAPKGSDVVSIEMEAGDLIRVPRGTLHWFNLCGDKTVRAIRLFQDVSGWAPHYTDSGVDAGYQPVCFGVQYIPADI